MRVNVCDQTQIQQSGPPSNKPLRNVCRLLLLLSGCDVLICMKVSVLMGCKTDVLLVKAGTLSFNHYRTFTFTFSYENIEYYTIP